MKKLCIVTACIAVGLLGLSSCESVTYSESALRTMELKTPDAHVLPVVSELEISQERITVIVTFDEELSQIDISQGSNSIRIKQLKAEALTKAAEQIKCDVLIAPSYQIETKGSKDDIIEVTVTGFPAMYKGFRTANSNDMDLILKSSNSSISLVPGINPNQQNIGLGKGYTTKQGPGLNLKLEGFGATGGELNFVGPCAGLEWRISNRLSIDGQFAIDPTELGNWAALGGIRYRFSNKPTTLFTELQLGATSKVYYDDYYDRFSTEEGFAIAPTIGFSLNRFDISAGAIFMLSDDVPGTAIQMGITYNLPIWRK